MYFNVPKYTFEIYNVHSKSFHPMSIDFAISKFSVIMVISMLDNYMVLSYNRTITYYIKYFISEFVSEQISSFVFTYSRASIKYFFNI